MKRICSQEARAFQWSCRTQHVWGSGRCVGVEERKGIQEQSDLPVVVQVSIEVETSRDVTHW